MAKTRMNQGHRDILKEFADKKIKKNVDRKEEHRLYEKLLKATNKEIRKKYPETEMEILRKYELTAKDSCVKFVFTSGRIDGMSFNSTWETTIDSDGDQVSIYVTAIVDTPNSRGCRNNNVYPMPESFEKDLEEHARLVDKNNKLEQAKNQDVKNLIAYSKYIEDVLEVIKVPKDLEAKLLSKSTSLVALSPDVIKRIQADFNS